jgi:hypothetical protein
VVLVQVSQPFHATTLHDLGQVSDLIPMRCDRDSKLIGINTGASSKRIKANELTLMLLHTLGNLSQLKLQTNESGAVHDVNHHQTNGHHLEEP